MTAFGLSQTIKPRRLASGDRIALVAPASPFSLDELTAGVQELAALGFEATYEQAIFARKRFVAGDAALRASTLHAAWMDPSIAAVIAVRGGCGSAETLPLLDAEVMRSARKVFVGYSDVTALLWFHNQHGLVSFHGPMVERRLAAGEQGYHRASLLRAVCDAEPVGELRPPALEVLRPGEAAGVLLGGTLTQLTASLATPWAFDPPHGSLLFIEDVGERPYRVHRMLTQLAQAGIVSRARALIFGEFPSCDEPGGQHLVRDVLQEFVADFPGPVLFGFPSGHTAAASWTLPFGVQARVTSAPAALIIEEAAVT